MQSNPDQAGELSICAVHASLAQKGHICNELKGQKGFTTAIFEGFRRGIGDFWGKWAKTPHFKGVQRNIIANIVVAFEAVSMIVIDNQ